jgi:hypothetical protein
MQHLLQQELLPANAHVGKSRLSGHALGFTASIGPSIDPLPFLEQLMSNPLEGNAMPEEVEPLASLSSDTEAVVAEAAQSLWPAETMQVEYQLAPIEDSATTSGSLLQPTDLSALQFSLTRRELLNSRSARSGPSSAIGASSSNTLSERVLTAQDLYRQTEDSMTSAGPAIRESRLDGLTNVQFQYFDGSSWKREWNSDQAGGLPRAIALCFDFPATADMKPAEPKPSASTSEDDTGSFSSDNLLESEPAGPGLSFADAALAAEPTVESSSVGETGLMQAATHEIQVVVYVGGQVSSQGSKPPFGLQHGTTQNFRARGGFE